MKFLEVHSLNAETFDIIVNTIVNPYLKLNTAGKYFVYVVIIQKQVW